MISSKRPHVRPCKSPLVTTVFVHNLNHIRDFSWFRSQTFIMTCRRKRSVLRDRGRHDERFHVVKELHSSSSTGEDERYLSVDSDAFKLSIVNLEISTFLGATKHSLGTIT